jgi:hypothetical protein
MAEKIISPGVFTNEIDQTFLPSAVADIGAALVGPTVKGPSLVPTVVSSYSEYQAIFGDTFKSGSSYATYLTSLAAEQYLKNSDTLTVVRILDGTTSTAKSYVQKVQTGGADPGGAAGTPHYTGSVTASVDWTAANASFILNTIGDGAIMNNTTSSLGNQFSLGTNGIIPDSGSKHNLRWETTSLNKEKGTFTLLIRRGDDSVKRKQILETYNNLSLDPNSNNYVAKIIGDSYHSISGTESEPYITSVGQYPNQSKYVRVSEVVNTPDYLDENGNVRVPANSASLPGPNSGSFGGASSGFAGFDAVGGYGDSTAAQANYTFYDKIGDKSQGFDPEVDSQGKTAYNKALNLLSNQDEYDINLILIPGIVNNEHSVIVSKAIDVCEDRGDCFVIADPVTYGSALTTAKTQTDSYDSNYAAMYWPWVQIPENQLGKTVWVPPSVALGGIYAFNDKVAHPWFAPAGLNRGGIDTAIQAERKLTQSNRDDLYDASLNPIATFPGQGVTVFGQKTLQKKASALDRINVRRLLIKVKKFIASSSRFLVFEQNTAATRRRFLNIAQPFLENVQSNSGLNAFRVVMDESNNTPDVVDRNILYGQIFVQPTRTAEFIVLDFTLQPTGATFPE